MAQGFLGFWLALCGSAAFASCPDAPTLRAQSRDLWWVAGAAGETDAANRGAVVNLLLLRDGARLWLLGSGPSPAFARALDCAARQQIGQPVSDVISPRARAELVLGARGLAQARHWAHADVAMQMRRQCVHCVERLRERLGSAGDDLGADPVRLPERLVRGQQGTLGPWRWWRVARKTGGTLTLWQPRAEALLAAPGLVWTDGAPDLRDTDLASMQRAARALHRVAAPGAQAIGEQGAPADARGLAERDTRYWQALDAAVREGQARGDDGVAPKIDLPGVDPALTASPRHALNWQRAWRQAEDAAFDQSSAAGTFQRSLR